MVPKEKKETPAPPKTKATARALEAQKAPLKDVHSHEIEDPDDTHLLEA